MFNAISILPKKNRADCVTAPFHFSWCCRRSFLRAPQACFWLHICKTSSTKCYYNSLGRQHHTGNTLAITLCVCVCVCVDPTGCRTRGVRESQMPNTSLTSVKMGDQGATRGKVTQTDWYQPTLSVHSPMCCTVCMYLKAVLRFSPGNLSGNRKKLKGKKFRARSNSTE